MINAPLQFRQAAFKGDLESLKTLYAQDASLLDSTGESGQSAMHRAASRGHLKTVQWLHSKGAKINECDNEGNTPIYLAVNFDKLDVSWYLIQQKANVITPNAAGKQPLMMICEKEKYGTTPFSKCINPLKSLITQQVDTALSGQNQFNSVRLESNGAITYFHTDLQSEQFQKSVNENLGAHIIADGRHIPLKYNGRMVEQCNAFEKPMTLPPLVFLMAHSDANTYDLIENMLPFLLSIGYKGLCFEFDSPLNLDQTIDALNTKQATNQSTIIENELICEFLRHLKDINGLAYHGVDLPLGFLRLEQFKKSHANQHNIDERNRYIASQLATYAQQYQGGIITILGARHIGVKAELISKIGAKAFDFNLYNTICYSDNPNTEQLINQLEDLQITDDNLKTIGKLNNQDREILIKNDIRLHLERSLSPVETEYTKTVEPVLISREPKLKDKFTTLFRGEFVVDAVRPVQNAFEFQKRSTKLKALYPGLTTAYQISCLGQERTKSLAIPDINGGDNRLIHKKK